MFLIGLTHFRVGIGVNAIESVVVSKTDDFGQVHILIQAYLHFWGLKKVMQLTGLFDQNSEGIFKILSDGKAYLSIVVGATSKIELSTNTTIHIWQQFNQACVIGLTN